MSQGTTSSAKSALPPLCAIGAAVLARAFATLRLGDDLPLPREGGWARAVALALARTPELFAMLGALAAIALIAGIVPLGGAQRARRAAMVLVAMSFIAAAAAVLAILPPSLEQDDWKEAGEIMAFAQPRMVYGLSVLALAAQVIVLGTATAVQTARAEGVRGLAREPALSAMLAWVAIAAPVRWMWWSRDDGDAGAAWIDASQLALLAAVVLGAVQGALRARQARRRS